VTILTEFFPHIYFGGVCVSFWGPLSWSLIFGLAFATMVTLIVVPALYLMAERSKRKSVIILNHFEMGHALMYVPFLILILRFYMWIRKIKLDYGNLDY
jgi:Cu/Ag efflux pump CusA